MRSSKSSSSRKSSKSGGRSERSRLMRVINHFANENAASLRADKRSGGRRVVRGDLSLRNTGARVTRKLPSRNEAFLTNFTVRRASGSETKSHRAVMMQADLRAIMRVLYSYGAFRRDDVGQRLQFTVLLSDGNLHRKQAVLIGAGADGWVFRVSLPFGDVAIKAQGCGSAGYFLRERDFMRRATSLASRGVPHLTPLLAYSSHIGVCALATPLAVGDIATGVKNGDLTKSTRCFIPIVMQCVLSVYIFHRYFGQGGRVLLHHDTHQGNLLYYRVKNGGCASYQIGNERFVVPNCGFYVTIYDYARAREEGKGKSKRNVGYDYLRLFSSHAGFFRGGLLKDGDQRQIIAHCLDTVGELSGINIKSGRRDWDMSQHTKRVTSREICIRLLEFLEDELREIAGDEPARCKTHRRFILR